MKCRFGPFSQHSPHIPSQWKDATIYPIPKPMDWNCYLKNTRPITLLETARKLMTKIMTNRLANILHRHNILKGEYFNSVCAKRDWNDEPCSLTSPPLPPKPVVMFRVKPFRDW